MATPLIGFMTSRSLQTSKYTTQTFSYTGSGQFFTVPSNVTEIEVYMWGAGGQGATDDTYTSYGGAGAMVQGILQVIPGSNYNIIVGGGASNAGNNTYGGGGSATSPFGSAGGGFSLILQGFGTYNNLVIAGGGGGQGGGLQGGCGTFSGSAERGSAASAGGSGYGEGGTQSSGGAPGALGGTSGSYLTGGNGYTAGYSGGGGGGYYGGGGGGFGGGGGGSSLIDNLSLLPGEFTLGYNSPDSYSAPNSNSPYYVAGVAVGGYGARPDNGGTGSAGGNGLIVIRYKANLVSPQYFPFYPSMISSNLIWLDSSDPGSISKFGTSLYSWNNKGTINFSHISNTGAVATGVTRKNNRNLLNFPGNTYLVSDSTFFIPSTEKTCFMVYQRAGSGTNSDSAQFTFLRPYPTAQQRADNPSEFWYFMNLLINSDINTDNIVNVAGGYYYSMQAFTEAYDRKILRLDDYIDSSISAGSWNFGSPGTFISNVPHNLDSFQYFMGTSNANLGKDIGEYLLFTKALSDVDRQLTEGYLAWKWGLQSKFPSSHPYSQYPPTAIVPSLIPGLIVWLDAADTSQYTQSDSNVSTLGNKGSASALTGSNWFRNQFSFNGRPYLTTSAWLSHDITWVSQYRTFFCVSHVGNSNPSGYTAYWTASGFNIQVSDYQGVLALDYNGVDSIFGTTSQSNFYNKVSLVTFSLCTAGNGIYINGISQALDFNHNYTLPTGPNSYPQRYGGGFDLGDMLIYDADLSSKQRIQIEGYLAQKWGIASYLPITHPYSPNYGKSHIITYSNAGEYIFTVPAGVYSINVYAWGAGGGASFSNPFNPGPYGGFGGCGALLMGTMSCTPGCNYGILVGAGGSNGDYYIRGYAGDATYIQYPYTGVFFENIHIIPGGGGGGGIDRENNIEFAGGCGTIGNQAYSGGTTYQTQVLARTSAEIQAAGGNSNFGGGGNSITGDAGGNGGWGYHIGGLGQATSRIGYASGAGSSYFGSNLTLMRGEIQFGLESRAQEAPGSSIPWYVYPAGRGGDKSNAGGNGLIVLIY